MTRNDTVRAAGGILVLAGGFTAAQLDGFAALLLAAAGILFVWTARSDEPDWGD